MRCQEVRCPPLVNIMPCPVCKKPIGEDHRWCVFELLKTNKIQDVAQWEEMSRPKTILKGKLKIRVPKE